MRMEADAVSSGASVRTDDRCVRRLMWRVCVRAVRLRLVTSVVHVVHVDWEKQGMCTAGSQESGERDESGMKERSDGGKRDQGRFSICGRQRRYRRWICVRVVG
jgi:hypothetical protein